MARDRQGIRVAERDHRFRPAGSKIEAELSLHFVFVDLITDAGMLSDEERVRVGRSNAIRLFDLDMS